MFSFSAVFAYLLIAALLPFERLALVDRLDAESSTFGTSVYHRVILDLSLLIIAYADFPSSSSEDASVSPLSLSSSALGAA